LVVRSSARRRAIPLNQLADAYGDGATLWADGPTRVYGRLAEQLVAFCPRPLEGLSVLDLGSGTGVGSRAAGAVGASVVATDLAVDMLRVDQASRPPSAAGDALALPFRDGCVDVVLAPFSLNHLDDPATGVREAGRVGRLLLASTYAADDDHPAKASVETALSEAGWQRPEWYTQIKAAMATWGTVADATAVIERGGLEPLRVERQEIEFADLGPEDMVAWRMGLAHCAAFVAALDSQQRARVVARAIELLGPDPIPLVRSVIFLAASA
jgi:SAM-dependent methyltransferase